MDREPEGQRRTRSGLWIPAGGDAETGDFAGETTAAAGEGTEPPDGSAAAEPQAAAASGPASEADELRLELAAARSEAEGHKDSWLRAAAELENVRRRAGRDVLEAGERARGEVLLSLITVLDDVDRALEAAPPPADPEGEDPIVAGLRLIKSRLADALRRQGVEEIPALGEPFDPQVHEAVMQIPAVDVPEGHVAQILERGYLMGERVLRAARVAVARADGE